MLAMVLVYGERDKKEKREGKGEREGGGERKRKRKGGGGEMKREREKHHTSSMNHYIRLSCTSSKQWGQGACSPGNLYSLRLSHFEVNLTVLRYITVIISCQITRGN